MSGLSSLRIITAEEAEDLLDWNLIDTIREVLLSDAHSPPRVALTHNGVWLGAMPGAGLGMQAVKIVGVYSSNPQKDLPLVRGVLVSLREHDGEPLYIADAIPPTAYRTAAATCLALSLLGYQGEEPAAIIGAGVQGSYHAKCLREHFGVDEIIVRSRTEKSAKRLVEALSGGARLSASEDDIYSARLIVAATTSDSPVIKGSKLRQGTYVASLGAPKPVWELDEEVLQRARCVLADTVEGYWIDAGEADHTPAGIKVISLRSLIRREQLCDHSEIAVYKSVGTALFDLAAALYLGRKLGLIE
jgi:alanine dehydrogenase